MQRGDFQSAFCAPVFDQGRAARVRLPDALFAEAAQRASEPIMHWTREASQAPAPPSRSGRSAPRSTIRAVHTGKIIHPDVSYTGKLDWIMLQAGSRGRRRGHPDRVLSLRNRLQERI